MRMMKRKGWCMGHKSLALSVYMSAIVSVTFADITVSDVEVFSGYPWKEVVIGYTITGTDDKADGIRLTATDKATNQIYATESGSSALTGVELTEGHHVMRWNAASEGAKFSSSNVVFSVSVINLVDAVQLWANGPYWAGCNVGATKPEEYGYYFWCGDTIGYKRNASNNGWVSVKTGSSFTFDSENCPTYSKNNSALKSAGYIDSTGNLVAKYDAATAHLGAPWRMPTDAEFTALISNCDTTWTTRNGVYGRLITGRGAYASKSIFLPAAGFGYASVLINDGSYGGYWSSSPGSGSSLYAWFLNFNSSNFYGKDSDRDRGRPVRPVRGFAQ